MLIEELKGLPNTLNLLLLLGLISSVFYWTGKNRLAAFLLGLTLVLFLVSSTSFFPRFAIKRMEARYDSFTPKNLLKQKGEPVLVHVLGAGYSLDPTLPPNSQLDLVTLGRLAEGIRICQQMPEGILICSGYSSLGLESQASIARRAAISLGFDSVRIETLTKPGTTQEEAQELKHAFGTDVDVILVTDAVHMPRAMRLFREQGFNPVPAPTNYILKDGPNQGYLKWLPSVRNISLTDRVLHEFLGNIKAEVF